ncbi:hypothetical protein RCL1_001562 [Eukaryota sp. TZLM3-RCL]
MSVMLASPCEATFLEAIASPDISTVAISGHDFSFPLNLPSHVTCISVLDSKISKSDSDSLESTSKLVMSDLFSGPGVTSLSLVNCSVNDRLLTPILKCFPALSSFTIDSCSSLRVFILKHSLLTSLVLNNCTELYMMDFSLPLLTSLSLFNLPKLSMPPTSITSRLAQLESFSISNCPSVVLPSSPASPKSCLTSSLRAIPLSIRNSQNADEQFSLLLTTGLKSLEVKYNHVIELMSLPNKGKSDSLSKSTRQLNLTPLSINKSELTSLSLIACSRFTGFKCNNIVPLSKLQFLDLSSNLLIEDTVFENLSSNFPVLSTLKAVNCPRLSRPNISHDYLEFLDLSFSNIQGLTGDLPLLSCLYLAGFTGFDSCLVSLLTVCPNIFTLDLALSSVSTLELHLPKLSELIVCGCSNLNLINFVVVPDLQLLDISGCKRIDIGELLTPLKLNNKLPTTFKATLPKKFSVLDVDISDPYLRTPLTFDCLERKYSESEFIWFGNGEVRQEKNVPNVPIWNSDFYMRQRPVIESFECF